MTSIWNRLHAGSPVWLQNVALSAYGYHVARQRFGGEFRSLLEGAMRSTFVSEDELRSIQEEEWRRRISPALRNVAAYASPFALHELPSQPILTKDELRRDPARFTNARFPRSRRVHAHTSGTTGAGLRFDSTVYAQRRQWAFWWRYRQWHGIPLGEWSGVFGGRTVVASQANTPPFWRVNHGARSVMFSQYHLTPERVPLYIDAIRSRRLRWLHGYPSLLALLSQVGIDCGLAGSVGVRWVTTGAENLLDAQRRVIERMFGVVPRQHYGLAEGVANISECPQGRLHVDEDFSVVEFLRREDGLSGTRIVGTTLDNEAMPLIRYDTGDIALLAEGNSLCRCGRAGRIVKSLDGRREDYLVLADGSMVGRVDHLFKDAENVTEAQIVQSNPGRAIFRIVRGTRYTSEDERALIAEAGERFGDRLQIAFEYVDCLPRSARGKLRLVESSLNFAKIAHDS